MKKMRLTYVLLIALMILSSCSNDDNNDNATEASIIGSWNGVSSTFNGENTGIPDNSIVKFTSDNKTEFIYEGFGNSGEDITETGSWTLNGNTLTITWTDSDPGLETYILTINELTETSLKWETTITGEGILKETFNR